MMSSAVGPWGVILSASYACIAAWRTSRSFFPSDVRAWGSRREVAGMLRLASTSDPAGNGAASPARKSRLLALLRLGIRRYEVREGRADARQGLRGDRRVESRDVVYDGPGVSVAS